MKSCSVIWGEGVLRWYEYVIFSYFLCGTLVFEIRHILSLVAQKAMYRDVSV